MMNNESRIDLNEGKDRFGAPEFTALIIRHGEQFDGKGPSRTIAIRNCKLAAKLAFV